MASYFKIILTRRTQIYTFTLQPHIKYKTEGNKRTHPIAVNNDFTDFKPTERVQLI